jgi:hypothetical protein
MKPARKFSTQNNPSRMQSSGPASHSTKYQENLSHPYLLQLLFLSSIFKNPLALLFLFKDKGLGGDSSGSYCHPLMIAKNQKFKR